MCSPIKLHKFDRTEGRTRPVEAHDVKLERSMTDDIVTYLRALDCGRVLDVDEEDGEVMDNRRPGSMTTTGFSSQMSQLPSGWSAGRRSGFACPLDAPWKAREMDEMAGDLAKRGVSPTGGCCSTPPAAIATARRARIRPGRLYSCTRTMHNQHGKVGSAKDRSIRTRERAYLQ